MYPISHARGHEKWDAGHEKWEFRIPFFNGRQRAKRYVRAAYVQCLAPQKMLLLILTGALRPSRTVVLDANAGGAGRCVGHATCCTCQIPPHGLSRHTVELFSPLSRLITRFVTTIATMAIALDRIAIGAQR